MEPATELESPTFSGFTLGMSPSQPGAFVSHSSPGVLLIAHSGDLSTILTSQSKGESTT